MPRRLAHRYVRPDAADRALMAEIEDHLVQSYVALGIDPVRFRWRFRVREYADRPWHLIEVLIPPHPADRAHGEGRDLVRRVVHPQMTPCLRLVGIDEVLGNLHRHVLRERRLAEAGHDPFAPPAESFVTDLIFRRALEHHGVDRDALVMRGTGAFSTPSPNIDRGDVHRLVPKGVLGWSAPPKPVLPVDFWPCHAEFDVDRLFLWSLRLSPEVHIVADPNENEADVDIKVLLPETILNGLVGRRLNEVVEHPVLDDDRLVILFAEKDFGWTSIRVTDPLVPLA